MARTAHRTVIISAAFALASWALAAGAPVLAATGRGKQAILADVAQERAS